MEEEKNNFKKAFEKEAPEHLQRSSLNNTKESVNTVRSVFEVLDLYISKFFEAIIHPFKETDTKDNRPIMGMGMDIPVEEEPENEDENEDEQEKKDNTE